MRIRATTLRMRRDYLVNNKATNGSEEDAIQKPTHGTTTTEAY